MDYPKSDHFHPKSESEEYVQCGAELPIGCEPLPLSEYALKILCGPTLSHAPPPTVWGYAAADAKRSAITGNVTIELSRE